MGGSLTTLAFPCGKCYSVPSSDADDRAGLAGEESPGCTGQSAG